MVRRLKYDESTMCNEPLKKGSKAIQYFTSLGATDYSVLYDMVRVTDSRGAFVIVLNATWGTRYTVTWQSHGYPITRRELTRSAKTVGLALKAMTDSLPLS